MAKSKTPTQPSTPTIQLPPEPKITRSNKTPVSITELCEKRRANVSSCIIYETDDEGRFRELVDWHLNRCIECGCATSPVIVLEDGPDGRKTPTLRAKCRDPGEKDRNGAYKRDPCGNLQGGHLIVPEYIESTTLTPNAKEPQREFTVFPERLVILSPMEALRTYEVNPENGQYVEKKIMLPGYEGGAYQSPIAVMDEHFRLVFDYVGGILPGADGKQPAAPSPEDLKRKQRTVVLIRWPYTKEDERQGVAHLSEVVMDLATHPLMLRYTHSTFVIFTGDRTNLRGEAINACQIVEPKPSTLKERMRIIERAVETYNYHAKLDGLPEIGVLNETTQRYEVPSAEAQHIAEVLAGLNLDQTNMAVAESLNTLGQLDSHFLSAAKATIMSKGNALRLTETPRISFQDIGGYQYVKDAIMRKLLLPLRNPEVVKHFGEHYRPTRGILFVGPPGTGKAQPLDAKILTPNGWARMADIKVGDHVVGSDGKPTRVLGVFPQGRKIIYRVTMTDGSSAECCEEHLWNVATSDRLSEGYGYKTLQLREFKGDLLSGVAKKKWRIPLVAPVEFPARTFEIHPYVLGALLGDGCFNTDASDSEAPTIMFSCADQDILDRMTALMPETELRHTSAYDYTIPKKGGRNNKPNPLSMAIAKLGLSRKRSWEKAIPEEYLFSSVEQRLELLKGLLDTDGTVEQGMPVFTTTSHQLANDVIHIVESLGWTASQTEKEPIYTHKGEKRTGRTAYTVRIKTPPGINPFGCKRKADAFRGPEKYGPVRIIDSVEVVGEKEAQCIMVQNADGLYVTDRFIVTHNTQFGRATAHEVAYGMAELSPELFRRSLVGESEKTTRQVLNLIRAAQPIVVWVDEAEAMMPHRGKQMNLDSGVSRNINSMVLAFLDDPKYERTSIWLASTNRILDIDPAFLRPGRMDDVIYVGYPDEEARQEIFKVHLGKPNLPVDEDVYTKLEDRIVFTEKALGVLLESTVMWSGAEIRDAVETAIKLAGQEMIQTGTPIGLALRHLEKALTRNVPVGTRIADEQRMLNEVEPFASDKEHIAVYRRKLHELEAKLARRNDSAVLGVGSDASPATSKNVVVDATPAARPGYVRRAPREDRDE